MHTFTNAASRLKGAKFGVLAGLWVLATEIVYSELILPYPIRFDARQLLLYVLIAAGLGVIGLLTGVACTRAPQAGAAAAVGMATAILAIGLRVHDLTDAGASVVVDGGLVIFVSVTAALVAWLASRSEQEGARRAAPTVLLAASLPGVVAGGKLLVHTGTMNVPVPLAFAVVALWPPLMALIYRGVVGRMISPLAARVVVWIAPIVMLAGAGMYAILEGAVSGASAVATAGAPGKPPIVWITIDTLRADRLSVYGHDSPTTRNLEAFARRATLYTHCLAQGPSTSQSVPSLLAGLTPYRHGAVTDTRKLPDAVRLVPEMLRDRGYQTIGQSANPWVSERYGMAQGFEDFRLYNTDAELMAYDVMKIAMRLAPYQLYLFRDWLPSYAYTPIRPLVSDALDILMQREVGRPLFLYLQPVDPHGPYQPPLRHAARWTAPFDEKADLYVGYWKLKTGVKVTSEQLSAIKARYDAEIAYVDAEIGRLFAELEDMDLFDDALIIITSDHGEQFDEHGLWRHSNSLYQALLHVPLLIKYPRQRQGVVVDDWVATVDIVPTIMHEVGGSCDGCDGRPLQDLVRGGERPIFAYTMARDVVRPVMRSVVAGGWKLIQVERHGVMREELFHVASDPRELHDVGRQHPDIVAGLRRTLESYEATAAPAPTPEVITIQGADAERLKALGYIQ